MDELDEKVLDITQRQKRAMILRRYHAKVERARELAQKRLAPEKNIKKRAYAQARQIVRKRFAGARGAEYEKLGPSEKMAIDRAIEKKTALIKKLALRLIPRVKQAEAKRLQSFMKGQSMDNAGAKEGHAPVTEQLNNLFAETFDGIAAEKKKAEQATSKNDNVIFYGKFDDEKKQKTPVYKAIAKKAARADISEDVLGIVYDRGLEAWNESVTVSPQQYAFARVNSFVNMGKTYFDEDSDLVDMDENFMDGKGPGKPGDAARHGLKGKSAAELKKIRSSDSASPRRKQLAHWMLNMHHNEETELEERGLWDNIHAKRERIKRGSGERMRKPGSKGAPTAQNFKDAAESVQEGYDVNSNHYKALTDLDLNTKNRDMTTQNDGYGPLNPNDIKGSKPFWEAKAKMWKTTPEAAMEARCRNCAAFNQSKEVLAKMAEGLGPAGEKIEELANLGFCELFEFKCAGDRTCNKWLMNGPITEEDTNNGTQLVDKESKNSKARKKIENVDRKPPHIELTKQMEIYRKIIEKKEGNSEVDPAKREIGTDSLVKAFKKDTPGEGSDLNESFNLAFQAGIGTFMTAGDMGMKIKGGFALHPSVEQEVEEVEEDVKAGDKEPVVIPAHKDANGNTIPAKTVMRRTDKKIIKSGNVHDGDA